MAKDREENPGSEESKLDRIISAIEKLAQVQLATLQAGKTPDPQNSEIIVRLTEALERVSQNQIKGAEVIANAQRQIHRPSNEVVHLRSVFHPRGNPSLHPPEANFEQVRLRCDCHVPKLEQPNDNMLTREETELLNILTECPGNYVITRIDDTKVKMGVKVEYALDEVTPNKLFFTHDTAFNNEYFRLMPALHSQIRQMLKQHSSPDIRRRADGVLTMDEERDLIAAGKLSVAA